MLIQELATETIEKTLSYEEEREKPMPSLLHSTLQTNIIVALSIGYKKRFSIKSELALSLEGWGAVPDICIFEPMQVDFRHDVIKVSETPLGVIEILSPTQAISELSAKAEMYFLKGVKSYWLVIPSLENIYVFEDAYNYQMFSKKQLLKDSVLDLEIDLKEIFQA